MTEDRSVMNSNKEGNPNNKIKNGISFGQNEFHPEREGQTSCSGV